MSLFAELKRRNVFRVGIAYAVAAWIILQLADVIGDIMELPEWGGKLILLLLIVGFIPALIFAWAFELTPEGVKREKDVDRSASIAPKTGRKLDYTIITLLAIGMAYFIWESRFARVQTHLPAVGGGQEAAPSVTPASQPAAGRASAAGTKSIAVLPFTNRSPNQDDIYFTDGVHDDLLTQLAKLNAFSVISRTSVMEYRDTTKNMKEIANELGVANIMEGAVQKSGNQVRINVQLIDASTDEHLWAEVYDRELTTENLFRIQSEIARNIAEALQATLTDEQIASVAQVPTEDVEAYDLYQQARRFALGESEIGFNTAIDLYEEALTLDPGFKLAWIGLARAHMTNYWQYGANPADRERARLAIDRARSLDDDFAELYMAEGFYWYWGFLDYDRAIENLEQAIRMMPGNGEAYMWLGWAQRRNGEWDAAIASMRESLRLDPRVVIHWTELASTYSYMGRQEEALATAQEAFDIAPDNYWARDVLGTELAMKTGTTERHMRLMVGAQHTGEPAHIGQFIIAATRARRFDEALAAIDLMSAGMEVGRSGLTLREGMRAWVLALAGRDEAAHAQARIALQRLDKLAESIPYDYRFSVAKSLMYAVLGDQERVRQLVREAQATHPDDAVDEIINRHVLLQALAVAGLVEEALVLVEEELTPPSTVTAPLMRIEPALDKLHDEPAFIRLLEEHR